MRIFVNGTAMTLENPTSISALLTLNGYDGKLVAVAVNDDFLPKSGYSDYIINDNDRIEIVAPMQGG